MFIYQFFKKFTISILSSVEKFETYQVKFFSLVGIKDCIIRNVQFRFAQFEAIAKISTTAFT